MKKFVLAAFTGAASLALVACDNSPDTTTTEDAMGTDTMPPPADTTMTDPATDPALTDPALQDPAMTDPALTDPALTDDTTTTTDGAGTTTTTDGVTVN